MPSQAKAPRLPATDVRDLTLRLDEFLPYRLSVLSNRVSRAIARRYADRFDVTIPEWRVLAILGSDGPLTANEIAGRGAMDKVAVSRAVARLLAAGRLERSQDPGDRRRLVLELSPAGAAIYGEIVPFAHEQERKLLEVLDPDDRRTLDRLLTTLAARAVALDRPA